MKNTETVLRALNLVTKAANFKLTRGKKKKTHLSRTEMRMKRLETVPRALNLVKKMVDLRLTRGK
jgi:hypothetical protein